MSEQLQSQSGEDVASTIDASSSTSPSLDATESASVAQSNELGAVIAESKRYRKRAQAAEKILEDLKQDLAAREKTIAEHEQTIADLRRRQMLDEALLDAGTIDLESARLLTELALSEMQTPDVDQAIEDLQRRKPHLFRSTRSAGARSGGPMSPKANESSTPHALALGEAAAEASATGKRADLLRYLRLRRSK